MSIFSRILPRRTKEPEPTLTLSRHSMIDLTKSGWEQPDHIVQVGGDSATDDEELRRRRRDDEDLRRRRADDDERQRHQHAVHRAVTTAMISTNTFRGF